MADFKNDLLQFEITLKRISTTAVLVNIYEHPDIKEKLKKIIRTKDYGVPFAFPTTLIKKEIIKVASQKINKLDLPKSLISEMQGLSIFFAKKLANWADLTLRLFNLDVSYLDTIYWTFYGTIDDGKIFDSYWRNHKSLAKIVKSDKETHCQFASRMACQFANEEIILAQQNAIIEQVQKHLKQVPLPDIKNKIDQIIASYLCYLYGIDYDYEQGKEVYKQFLESGKIDVSEAIFIAEGHKAIKCLWNFLDNADKKRLVKPLAQFNLHAGLSFGKTTFALDDPCVNEIEMIEIGKYADVVIFLINQMSPKEKSLFLTKNTCRLMKLFLSVWPYPEFCKKMLNEQSVRERISRTVINGEAMLKILLYRMVDDLSVARYVSGTCHYPSTFHEILVKILSLTTKEVKEKVFFEKSYYSAVYKKSTDVIDHFYEMFDLKALSIIINDKDLKSKRNQMISMGSKMFEKLINKGKFDRLISFMEKVLITNEERKKFIKDWDLENHALKADNPNIREKILGWLESVNSIDEKVEAMSCLLI